MLAVAIAPPLLALVALLLYHRRGGTAPYDMTLKRKAITVLVSPTFPTALQQQLPRLTSSLQPMLFSKRFVGSIPAFADRRRRPDGGLLVRSSAGRQSQVFILATVGFVRERGARVDAPDTIPP
ncbi:hypothetical protein BJV78DRAFT_1158967 [Lactifluus subvellereus]|nr:hypothetical protein BJV78DRAFT_1158967 [Lactifluus subvellereus]